MRNRTVLVLMSSAIGSLLWIAAPSAAAQHQHSQPAQAAPQPPAAKAREQELKGGKADDVSFEHEVRVGDAKLSPGKYRVEHRVEGAEHFVRFEALATTTPSAQKVATGLGVPSSTAGEVRCRLEALARPAKDTSLYLLSEDEGQRLTRLLIRGENVAHVF